MQNIFDVNLTITNRRDLNEVPKANNNLTVFCEIKQYRKISNSITLLCQLQFFSLGTFITEYEKQCFRLLYKMFYTII